MSQFLFTLFISLLLFSGSVQSEAISKEKKYDFKSPDIRALLKEKEGLSIPEKYELKHIVAHSKEDHKYPDYYVMAAEKGEPYRTIWEMNLIMRENRFSEVKSNLLKQLKSYPDNEHLYFNLAMNQFLTGEGMKKDDSEGRAKVFKEGRELSQKCITENPRSMLCHLSFGILTGRMLTNGSKFNQARYAGEIRDAWLKALKYKINFRLSNGITAPSAVNHSLGIFYRLTPDSFWLDLFFGIRGDIDKSIQYQRKAMRTMPSRVAYNLELAASLICKHQRDDDYKKEFNEGIKILKGCNNLIPVLKIDYLSMHDCGRMLKTPEIACGYSRDKQQNIDLDKIKKQIEDSKTQKKEKN